MRYLAMILMMFSLSALTIGCGGDTEDTTPDTEVTTPEEGGSEDGGEEAAPEEEAPEEDTAE